MGFEEEDGVYGWDEGGRVRETLTYGFVAAFVGVGGVFFVQEVPLLLFFSASPS